MTRLIYNALRTPDGTVIESRHRHDYNSYTDANGKTYMVDGGLDYARCSAHGDEEYIQVYSDDGHEKIREVLAWGTYGPNGDQPLKYVKLKDMSSDHILACLENVRGIYPQIREAFVEELKYREQDTFVTLRGKE